MLPADVADEQSTELRVAELKEIAKNRFFNKIGSSSQYNRKSLFYKERMYYKYHNVLIKSRIILGVGKQVRKHPEG